jgi:hypothetical protein
VGSSIDGCGESHGCQLIAEEADAPAFAEPRSRRSLFHRTDNSEEGPVEGGRYLASRIPRATFIELDGGDYWPWIGDQATVIRQIERFLATLREEEAELDRVLATVLFTDIVGSTEKAAELGDLRWRELRARERVKPLGLEVRAGLHTGEVEESGASVRGIAVNIGARVGAKAGASEVLVSQTVKDLVAGSRLSIEDRGLHELKGVPDRWRLYRVTP